MARQLPRAAWFVAVTAAFIAATPAPAVDDKGPDKRPRELHAVGIYAGVEKTGNKIHGGKAFVTVKRPGKRVTLSLSSYSSVVWEVTVGPDTRVEKVLLGGYHRQAVRGLPPDVEVVEAFHEGRRGEAYWLGYTVDSDRFHQGLVKLAGLTDLPLLSFQGTYDYRHENPIVIDRVQDDPRLSVQYPKVTPAAELPKELTELVFKALHYPPPTDGRGFGVDNPSYGDFTVAGPKVETLKPLPHGVHRLAYDPTVKKYYGVASHEAVEVDWGKKSSTVLDTGLDVPRLSWPSEVTFDSKRQRLLLTTHGGGGYLYAYSPKEGKWSVLAEKLGVDVLTYHPGEDALFGIAVGHGDEAGAPQLVRFNAEGAVVKKTPLAAPLHRWVLSQGPGVSRTRLVAAGKHLVVLTVPSSRGEGAVADVRTYIFVVDPQTGKAVLTFKGT